jgi:2-dehydro-3-deoxyphosphogluconate aldolase / (4S)-4-hydroxy-2-oxoglutarate aldolase
MTTTVASPTTAAAVLEVASVIPVVVIDDADLAVPIAGALRAGGLPIIEVTLRTPAALSAIAAIATELPDVVLGAGTVCSPAAAEAARAAGARFLVSPGSTERLLDAFDETALPYLAGCATPSDMMRVLDRGVNAAKLFPASAVGGTALLRAVAGPLPQLRFCPTGGITPANAHEYLALDNVGCVGGTWLTRPDVVARGDWATITDAARACGGLRPPA